MTSLPPNVYLFVLIAVAGFAVMMVGMRFTDKIRTAVQTTGLIAFLAGLSGALYFLVPLYLFATISTTLVGVVTLVDPLNLKAFVSNPRYFTLAGRSLIAIAIIFSLAYVNRFPPMLWLIPVVLYLLLYLVPSLKKHRGLITVLATCIMLLFLSYNALLIYRRMNPGMPVSFGFLERFLSGKGGAVSPATPRLYDSSPSPLTPPLLHKIPPDVTVRESTSTDLGTATDSATSVEETTLSETETIDDNSDAENADTIHADLDALKKLYADEVKLNEQLQKEIEELKKQKKTK